MSSRTSRQSKPERKRPLPNKKKNIVSDPNISVIKHGTASMWFLCAVFALILAVATGFTFVAITNKQTEIPTRVFKVDDTIISLKLPVSWSAEADEGQLVCTSATGFETLKINPAKYTSLNAAASMLSLEIGDGTALTALTESGVWSTVTDGMFTSYFVVQEIDSTYVTGKYTTTISSGVMSDIDAVIKTIHAHEKTGTR